MGDKFLEQIAKYYTAPSRINTLSRTYFIMPNKRSGMFLKDYIQKSIQEVGDRPVFMPRFATLQRFASSLLRISEAGQNELLFMLYNAYLEEARKLSNEEFSSEFDKFIFWGDMILSDFDLIDKSLASPDALYSNLSDNHAIQANYLTEEQKEIIERIWGHTPLTEQTDSFWLHTKGNTNLQRKFVSLWEILGPMYKNLRSQLEKANLTTPGLILRKAAELLSNEIPADILKHRYVFVGLSDLSNAELSIIESLSRAGIATFFWDRDLPLYQEGDEEAYYGDATALIKALAKKYPMPEDFKYTPATGDPQITIYGIPSTMGMGKGAGEEISRMIKNKTLTSETARETAVVLPDPAQLMPFILSLPELPAQYDRNGKRLPGMNVTMALPYADTTFATLLRTIINMQHTIRRNTDGKSYYMYEQVLEILQHPHLSVIVPEKIDLFRQKVIDENKPMIEGEKLARELPELSFIFRPITDSESIEDTCAYLRDLLLQLSDKLSFVSKDYPAAKLEEFKTLDYLLQQVDSLEELIKKYGVDMKESTFIHLFERILNARPINLEGSPLAGLQVMGVLETRCLDFDNLIYLSLNEKIFPRRDYVRTMIPNALRRIFGLPSIQHSESFYSYYFFRSLSRARNVTLFYDSRTPGSSNSEMSRFLTRLIYLPGKANIKHYRANLISSIPEAKPIIIEKTPEVMKRIKEYLEGGRRYLSASSLKNLVHCPLRFYLQNVSGINYDDQPHDYLSAAMLGTIFHDTMRELLLPYEGKLVDSSVIDTLLQQSVLDDAFYKSLAEHSDYKEGQSDSKTRFEYLIVKSAVQHQVRSILLAEKALKPYIYIKGEKEYTCVWNIVPGKLSVNFNMHIDRMDQLSANRLRFIDYKTGADILKIGMDIKNLFNNGSLSGVLQLMIYAEAFHDSIDSTKDIEIMLYNVGDIVKRGIIENITYKSIALADCPDFPEGFRTGLNDRMIDFFISDNPIKQTDKTENCKYCQFLNLCNRNLGPKSDYNAPVTI